MYDIEFFRKADKLKGKIVSGDLTTRDVRGIEVELDRIRSRVPALFNFETTNFCNMTCIMCPRTTLMQRENQWIENDVFENVLDQIIPHRPESLEEFWKFIENRYGITFKSPSENAFYFYVSARCVTLHGFGEPMVDKNIVTRVQACTDRGIPTYFSCVPANANAKRVDRIMEAGLNVIKFSIDSLDDVEQKRIRGRPNNFQKSYDTILEILEMKEKRGHKTIVVPCMIALSEDMQSREMHDEFLDLWRDLDVFAYVKSQDNRWLYEEGEELVNHSHYMDQYCEFPWTSVTVMADGSVVPCTQDYDCEMIMGDAKKDALESIWNNENYRNLRKWHINGNFPKGFKCSERCDLKKLHQYVKEG